MVRRGQPVPMKDKNSGFENLTADQKRKNRNKHPRCPSGDEVDRKDRWLCCQWDSLINTIRFNRWSLAYVRLTHGHLPDSHYTCISRDREIFIYKSSRTNTNKHLSLIDICTTIWLLHEFIPVRNDARWRNASRDCLEWEISMVFIRRQQHDHSRLHWTTQFDIDRTQAAETSSPPTFTIAAIWSRRSDQCAERWVKRSRHSPADPTHTCTYGE